MKKLWNKLWNKAIDFLKWVWSECKDWHTLVLLGIVSLVLSFPIWMFYALGFIFGWNWAHVVATVIWGFWMLPGAPFFAVAVSITLAIKKIFQKVKKKKSSEENQQSPESDDEKKDHE